MEEGLLVLPTETTRERKREWPLAGEIKDEGRRLGSIAGPMMAMSLSMFLIPVSSNMMVGHLGELALSSTAIATSLAAVTGFSLLVRRSTIQLASQLRVIGFEFWLFGSNIAILHF